MTLRLLGGMDSGFTNPTLASQTEFSTISVGASGFIGPVGVLDSPYCMRAFTGASAVVAYGENDWGVDDDIIYVKIHVLFVAVPTAITAFLAVTDSVPTQLFALRVNASGFWQVENNANATTYTSTVNKPVANRWHLIEFYWKRNATTGEFTFKVDQVADTDLTQTGLNNGTAVPRRIRIGCCEAAASQQDRYFDNWAVNSGSGTYNNTWFGRVVIRPLSLCSSDLGNWTVVDAGKVNWQCMWERPWADLATDMIKSSTASQEERMGLLPIGSANLGTVVGVVPVIRMRRAVAGSAAGVTLSIKSGATDGTASAALDAGGVTFKTFYGAIQETDPATGVLWVAAGLNAMKLKIVKDAGANEADINAAFVYICYAIGLKGVIAGVAIEGTRTVAPQRQGAVVTVGLDTGRGDRRKPRHWKTWY
jgi:hypothetical protein